MSDEAFDSSVLLQILTYLIAENVVPLDFCTCDGELPSQCLECSVRHSLVVLGNSALKINAAELMMRICNVRWPTIARATCQFEFKLPGTCFQHLPSLSRTLFPTVVQSANSELAGLVNGDQE